MQYPFVANVVDLAFGSEGLFAVDSLGPLVDDASRIPVVGTSVIVSFDEVLLQLRTDPLQQITHVTDHRVVPQNRVLTLNHVVDRQRRENDEDDGEAPPPRRPSQRGKHRRCRCQDHRHRNEQGCHTRLLPCDGPGRHAYST